MLANNANLRVDNIEEYDKFFRLRV